MPRNVINKSISFDPELFPKMEDRREQLDMDRSEYVKRCIQRDLLAGGDMGISIASGKLTGATEKTKKIKVRRRTSKD